MRSANFGRSFGIWVVIVLRTIVGVAACIPIALVVWAGRRNGLIYIPYALLGTPSGWVFLFLGIPSITVALGLLRRQLWVGIVAILSDALLIAYTIGFFTVKPESPVLDPVGMKMIAVGGLLPLAEAAYLAWTLWTHWRKRDV